MPLVLFAQAAFACLSGSLTGESGKFRGLIVVVVGEQGPLDGGESARAVGSTPCCSALTRHSIRPVQPIRVCYQIEIGARTC